MEKIKELLRQALDDLTSLTNGIELIKIALLDTGHTFDDDSYILFGTWVRDKQAVSDVVMWLSGYVVAKRKFQIGG